MRLILAIRAFFAVLFGQTLGSDLLTASASSSDGSPPSDIEGVKTQTQLAMLREKLEQNETELRTLTASYAKLQSKLDKPVENTDAAAAVQVLAVMQSEARLLDFISEDITDYSDEDVGAAVRDVHRGLCTAIKDHFPLIPLRNEEEDSPITVPEGFNPREFRLVGNVIGSPPFSGTLNHRGWRVQKVQLPKLPSGDAALIATPAEVEI